MEEYSRKRREEMDRDVAFTHAIKAGKRMYYMDVRKTRSDELYLTITESKKIVSGDGADQQFSFEKHKIFLYKEDFSKFIEGLSEVMRYIHANEPVNADATPEESASDSGSNEPEPADAESAIDDLKIEF